MRPRWRPGRSRWGSTAVERNRVAASDKLTVSSGRATWPYGSLWPSSWLCSFTRHRRPAPELVLIGWVSHHSPVARHLPPGAVSIGLSHDREPRRHKFSGHPALLARYPAWDAGATVGAVPTSSVAAWLALVPSRYRGVGSAPSPWTYPDGQCGECRSVRSIPRDRLAVWGASRGLPVRRDRWLFFFVMFPASMYFMRHPEPPVPPPDSNGTDGKGDAATHGRV